MMIAIRSSSVSYVMTSAWCPSPECGRPRGGWLSRGQPHRGTVCQGGVMMGDELGSFLRARREMVRPEDVGLPRGERRRTPGLRRSEVAILAGISVEYLTRLEQGRDRHPSTQVVAAVAGALRLDRSDRRHLHELVALSQRS